MTTLNSLEVQGIRSFSPLEPETINFQKPLTLIVGHNGAGKTTIVECLKMITSGILPPSADKGKCFIHSNKLSNSSEVHAHIKLKYTTFGNEEITATRTYTLSTDRHNAKKTVFKACDNLLEFFTEGQSRSISMKCNEMDSAVSTTMGLTRAMIDNVIFCHQDENNWALDDVAKVKARFDDLLETSRYTKALNTLNKLRKDQDEAIKSKKVHLDTYKSKILQVADLRKQIQNNEDEISRTRNDINQLEEDVKMINDKLSNLDEEYNEICVLAGECTISEELGKQLETECNTLQDTLSEIYNEPLDGINKYHTMLSEELRDTEERNLVLLSEIECVQSALNELYQKLQHDTTKNNAFFLRENRKSLEETILNLQNEILSELNINDMSSYDDELINSTIELLKDETGDESLSSTIKESLMKIEELEAKLLDKSAELRMEIKTLETLNNDINETQRTITKYESVKGTYESLQREIQICQNEVKESDQRLNDLMNERIELFNEANEVKLPNIGMEKDELESAIKFLNLIVQADEASIVSYLHSLEKFNLDEDTLVTVIKRILEEVTAAETSVVTEFLDASRKLTTFEGLICKNCGNKVDLNERIGPNNAFNNVIKIATNQRIKHYIACYSSLFDHDNVITAKINESIQHNKSELQTKIDKLRRCMVEDEAIKRQLEELEQHNVKLRDLILKRDEVKISIDDLESLIASTGNELVRLRQEHGQHREELNELKQYRTIKLSKIDMLINCLEDARSKLINISDTEQEQSSEGSQTTQIDQLNEILLQKKEEQKGIAQNINEQKKIIELLEKNINYKTKLELLNNTNSKINELKHKLGDRNPDDLKSNIDSLNAQASELTLKIATMNGILLTRECYTKELRRSLESDEVSDIQGLYTEIFIELKTHIMARDDLEKYIKYMEAGLHEYHIEKINCINNNLRRIWREIYAGNHIDYIAVQSNVDESSLPMSTSSRSYNYKLAVAFTFLIYIPLARIIMVTYGGVELEMKGHCSAGERILTSLVMRIALIESFNVNCNFLALDEPTTNLDSDNIQNLETSLAKLVNDSNFNFQLIIITHDEMFAKKMATLCSCDKYFSIEKTCDGSKIRIVGV